jgi:hypothetical protein
MRAAPRDRRLEQLRRSADTKAGRVIVAFRGGTWMPPGATVPLARCSCGYVAVKDGCTDLHHNGILDWSMKPRPAPTSL